MAKNIAKTARRQLGGRHLLAELDKPKPNGLKPRALTWTKKTQVEKLKKAVLGASLEPP